MGNFTCGTGGEALHSGERRLIPYTSEIICTLAVSGVDAKGGCILLTEDGKIAAIDKDNPKAIGVECNPAGTGIFGVRLNQISQDIRSIFFVATINKNTSPQGLFPGLASSDAKSFKAMNSGTAGLKCPGKELCSVALSPHTDGNAVVFMALHRENAGSSELNSHRGGWCVEAVAKCYHCFNGDAYLALQPKLERLSEAGLESRPTVMLGVSNGGICSPFGGGLPEICFVEQDIRPPDETCEVKPMTPRQSALRPYASPSSTPGNSYASPYASPRH
eukprot:gnl/MRDRNA2_/MRDRNA2_212261_c0_seq1.p1 gnl/MRDRNA2_/MRDRNA2_212261_c0~~gnl/MRDRNA2_/MRDRNA2_212261_c0_seq1.p1  ORF type:complete len:276 (-),score=41.62 gnl/MRDRNA2_/MRDRNA2_212261_c0_seq1:35-862(-)